MCAQSLLAQYWAHRSLSSSELTSAFFFFRVFCRWVTPEAEYGFFDEGLAVDARARVTRRPPIGADAGLPLADAALPLAEAGGCGFAASYLGSGSGGSGVGGFG